MKVTIYKKNLIKLIKFSHCRYYIKYPRELNTLVIEDLSKVNTSKNTYTPCIVCITTEGNLERNRTAIESATPIKRYDNIAPVKAKIKANFSPNVSPARPKNGPPINCATAKTVCNCPKVVGSAPSFLDKY